MFGSLKNKLKKALNVFSKKTEEEAEVFEKEVTKEPVEKKVSVQKSKLKEKKPEKKEKKPEAEKKEPVQQEKPPKKDKKEGVEKPAKEKKAVDKIPADQVKITYFVHGTTTDNEKGLATGWAHGELSQLGIEQSKKLPELVEEKFEVIFCSDLKRAVDSANLAFKGEKIIEDDRLREANYGDWNELKKDWDIKDYIAKEYPNGECYEDVEKRIVKFLNDIYEKFKGKHIAIVAHQAPQLALDVVLKKKTWTEAIKEDWRKEKRWKPGWKYIIKCRIEEKPEEGLKEKKSFFGKIKERFSSSEKEVKEEQVKEPEVIVEKEVVEEKVEKKSDEKGEQKFEEEAVERIAEENPEKVESKGFFGKVKQSLTTKTISSEKFEELFWELEVALLENNVSVEVIERIKEDLDKELVNKPLPRDVGKKIQETLEKTLTEILSYKKIDIMSQVGEKKPFVVAFFGINGAGKTTSIAKLTKFFQDKDKSVVLAACDTFRAAAIQQLEEHADKLDVKMIKHDYGSDSAAVAYDAIKYAEKNKVDVVLIDTAGRLHSNTNLMAELEKIIRISKPDLKIFVGESITGNDCIEQARKFNELVEMDGAILTKADVDEKGGAPLSISYVIGKPILFLGVGQNYEDLEEFDAKKILDRLGF